MLAINKSETKMKKLLFQKLSSHGGILPPKKKGDCAFDLVCAEDRFISAPSVGEKPKDIPIGVAVKIPHGYFGLIINRSSASRTVGVHVIPGIIDEGYVGPLYACVYPMGEYSVYIKKGDRVAQLILLPSFTPEMEEVESLPITERGSSGFGSTGINT